MWCSISWVKKWPLARHISLHKFWLVFLSFNQGFENLKLEDLWWWHMKIILNEVGTTLLLSAELKKHRTVGVWNLWSSRSFCFWASQKVQVHRLLSFLCGAGLRKLESNNSPNVSMTFETVERFSFWAKDVICQHVLYMCYIIGAEQPLLVQACRYDNAHGNIMDPSAWRRFCMTIDLSDNPVNSWVKSASSGTVISFFPTGEHLRSIPTYVLCGHSLRGWKMYWFKSIGHSKWGWKCNALTISYYSVSLILSDFIW